MVCYALPNEDYLTQWTIAIIKEITHHCVNTATPFWTIMDESIPGWQYNQCIIPLIRGAISHFHYDHCQKVPFKELGLLPEHDLANTTWYEIALDVFRLWSTKIEHFNSEFYALKCIGITTNLVELVHSDTKASEEIVTKFNKYGLLDIQDQYKLFMIIVVSSQDTPLPIFLGHWESIQMTNQNPQSNSVCKCMH